MEIEVDRPFAETAGLGRPDGFRLNPHALEGEPDADAESLAERWHQQWVRYSGSLEVTTARSARVVFPVCGDREGSGDIRLRYAEAIAFGGGVVDFVVLHAVVPYASRVRGDGVEQDAAADEALS